MGAFHKPGVHGGRETLVALLILFLGISLFHGRGLWPGRTFLPVDLASNNLPWRAGPPQPLQNWLVSDPLYETYPFLVHNVESIRGGEWPIWNPDILLGHPTAADPLAQSFYPVFTGLALVFGAARGLALGLWLHALLAAGLSYGLLRTLRFHRPAALLGAFTYALGGYMVTWFEHAHYVGTMSWLPGVLWCYELAQRRRSLPCTALAGLMMGLAIVAGQFMLALTFGLFLGLYALGRTVQGSRRRGRLDGWPLLVLVLTLGLGVLVSAVQTVPFARFLPLSQRPLDRGLLDPLSPHQLVSLIVPDFYGNPATGGPYWGALNYAEGTIYAGLVTLLLALLAPLCARRPLVRWIGLATVVLIFFVVGGPGVGLLGTLPVVKYASLHRSAFLLSLLIGLLAAATLSAPRICLGKALLAGLFLAGVVGAAWGLDWGEARSHWSLLREPLRQATGWLVAAVTLLWLRERMPHRRRLLDGGLVLLAFADLFLFGHRFNPAGPIDALMPETPAIAYLKEQAGHQRVVAYQRDDYALLGPNVPSIYGLAEGGGYSSLLSYRYQELVEAGDPKGAISSGIGRWLKLNPYIVFFYRPSPRLLDLLQVGYVVSPFPLADPGMTAVFHQEGPAGDVYIYARSTPLPRAYVVYAAEVIPDEARAIDRLLDPAFDPRHAVITPLPLELPHRPSTPGHPAEIVAYRNSEVVVEAALAQRGLLVLGDQFHPGWRATVDGEPASVLRVNQVMRGLLLPPGRHRAHFRFRPVALNWGDR